jgi:hypothetical protein
MTRARQSWGASSHVREWVKLVIEHGVESCALSDKERAKIGDVRWR